MTSSENESGEQSDQSGEQSDQSRDAGQVGVPDEDLPEDLRPSEDNPLAEPLSDEEAPDDIDDLDLHGQSEDDDSEDEDADSDSDSDSDD